MTEKKYDELHDGKCICVDNTGKQYEGYADTVKGIGRVVFVCYPASREIVKYLQ